jgi:hypothetical protein
VLYPRIYDSVASDLEEDIAGPRVRAGAVIVLDVDAGHQCGSVFQVSVDIDVEVIDAMDAANCPALCETTRAIEQEIALRVGDLVGQ